MSVKVEGKYPKLERIPTGLDSFDWALRDPRTGTIGMPMRTITMLYGNKHSGKSTLSYYLAGVPNPKGVIMLCDVEGLDVDYLPVAMAASGFDGTVRLVNDTETKKGKEVPRLHADMITDLADSLEDDIVSSAIFDSMSAYIPAAEEGGDVGEAIVGRRARDMAQLARRTVQRLRYSESPRNLFVVNHPYQVIGGRGHVTAGGTVLPNLSGVLIYMWRKESGLCTSGPRDGLDDFVITGKVEKLRYGGKGGKFTIVCLAGVGISKGMTAVFDCMEYGLMERGKAMSKGGTGNIRQLVEAAAAGETKPFAPFYKALKEYHNGTEPD